VYVDKAKVIAQLRSRQLQARADWVDRELPGLIDTYKTNVGSRRRYHQRRARQRMRQRPVSRTTALSRMVQRPRERAAVSIHLSGGGGTLRRVVLSCDVAGCPVQLEPPAIEAWRNDADARSWARDHAVGWTFDPIRQTDYCPEHARFSTAPAAGLVPPRPTAAARDGAGNPLNRDEYAERLRERLGNGGLPTGQTLMLTAAQAVVAARLLDELAGVYRGESLGLLARELSALLESRFGDRG
jgi:hypothetical protein